MPVDEYGIRADLWVDMNSPVARNNPGQLYETYINRISEFVRRKCEAVFNSHGSDDAFEVLIDWYNDVNPNYALIVRRQCSTKQDRRNVVKEAIETSPKIWIPPFLDKLCPSDDDFWNALTHIKQWSTKWDVRSTPVKYKSIQADGSSREFITEAKFAIGSKYIIHLNKIPEITASGPASVNHIGIPTKPTFTSKHFPVSTSPYRYGEDELRVMSISTDPREVARFQNLVSNSPTGVTATISALLLSEHPTRIKRIPISNGELMRTSAVLRLFHNIAATLGVETKNTKVVNFEVPEELADSIWFTDTLDYKNHPSEESEEKDTTSRRSHNKQAKMKKMLDLITDDDDDEVSSEEETEDA